MMIAEFIVIKCIGCGEVLSWQLPGGTEENTKNLRIGSILVEVRTEHLPNTIIECYG
jgi:hypothetical protein